MWQRVEYEVTTLSPKMHIHGGFIRHVLTWPWLEIFITHTQPKSIKTNVGWLVSRSSSHFASHLTLNFNFHRFRCFSSISCVNIFPMQIPLSNDNFIFKSHFVFSTALFSSVLHIVDIKIMVHHLIHGTLHIICSILTNLCAFYSFNHSYTHEWQSMPCWYVNADLIFELYLCTSLESSTFSAWFNDNMSISYRIVWRWWWCITTIFQFGKKDSKIVPVVMMEAEKSFMQIHMHPSNIHASQPFYIPQLQINWICSGKCFIPNLDCYTSFEKSKRER